MSPDQVGLLFWVEKERPPNRFAPKQCRIPQGTASIGLRLEPDAKMLQAKGIRSPKSPEWAKDGGTKTHLLESTSECRNAHYGTPGREKPKSKPRCRNQALARLKNSYLGGYSRL
jgi:hypothetical protein